ncbi:hypothetical protein FHR81_003715 [Actinoalloteichus hoggarensis]|uniref:Uncharacterized protein n=1 Tax=Actinoalloteichus hoggarensis TaxID=1470176 RepID=A0A221WBP3_9PSEU|nr:hypothetical protein AHOG_27275 [Actinoalloteichus hoggarensis]MBB5922658.1 hypothetical protein [Actinoalloteichus hoggarensis]
MPVGLLGPSPDTAPAAASDTEGACRVPAPDTPVHAASGGIRWVPCPRRSTPAPFDLRPGDDP